MDQPSSSDHAQAEKVAEMSVNLRDERIRRRFLGIPQREQSPFGSRFTDDNRTLSHTPTTEYAASLPGTGDDDSAAKRRTGSPSVYSYHSNRDISQFVKDVHGRYLPHYPSSRSNTRVSRYLTPVIIDLSIPLTKLIFCPVVSPLSPLLEHEI